MYKNWEKTFPIQFKDISESKAKFPFTRKMTNLNGNELYYYFDQTFTINTNSVNNKSMDKPKAIGLATHPSITSWAGMGYKECLIAELW